MLIYLLHLFLVTFFRAQSPWVFFSSIPPIFQQHYSTKFEFSLRHFWANSSLCEGNGREKREYPSLPDAFSWFKDRIWRVCLLGELFSSPESPYAPEEGCLPSLWKGKEEQGAMAQFPGLVVELPLLTCSHLCSPGWGEGKGWRSPAQLSCALGTNSISP